MPNNASSTTTYDQRLEAIKDGLRRLLDQASDRAIHFKDRTIDVEHRVEERVKNAAGTTTSWIKAHPVAAAAAAFALGYAVIRLARR